MGSLNAWVIPLSQVRPEDEAQVGGKAAKLARLSDAGFRVPRGFCITAKAYEDYLHTSGLLSVLQMELGRKPFEAMRWEEMWDTALRIRSAFLARSIPKLLEEQIDAALSALCSGCRTAVRSSALAEDTPGRSFAGLHESVVGVAGTAEVLEAVKIVWASLWSDAALLYRQELKLDPLQSTMAVLIQELIERDRSGVAFGRDPRSSVAELAIVEAVPGPCSDLVDGLVDPDHWELALDTGEVMSWRPGRRTSDTSEMPVLTAQDLQHVYNTLLRIESDFGWPPDMEWTGRASDFVVLQARPITTTSANSEDQKSWYLSLRPNMAKLRELRERVADQLIPELEALSKRLELEQLESQSAENVSAAIRKRLQEVKKWERVYWDEFIPFAHGVRQLGLYYNDAVRPADPYEFVGLLQGQEMLATRRNRDLRALAAMLRGQTELQDALQVMTIEPESSQIAETRLDLRVIESIPGGSEFASALAAFMSEHMNVTYDGTRLSDRPDALIRIALRLSASPEPEDAEATGEDDGQSSVALLECRLLEAVGEERQAEANEVLATARLSWRLRDDDNLLIGRLESQLIRAVQVGLDRLQESGRLRQEVTARAEIAEVVATELVSASTSSVVLPEVKEENIEASKAPEGERARQLVGQPASPGIATGLARRVRGADDLGSFLPGEVLICDAIQPSMTHLVPLAGAVVERRGGMLIHGAIIARELGIPCVNGIPAIMDSVNDGDVVTVDGHLGIVTVGLAEFELEAADSQMSAASTPALMSQRL